MDVIVRFTDAMNEHDLEKAVGYLAEDCVFEDTEPAPDGNRYEGRAAIRAQWAPMLSNENARMDTEDIFSTDDRVVQFSRYSWGDGHVRALNVFRVRDGAIAEMYCYVKG